MRFVQDHKDSFAVALLLRVLNVSSSTYYGWRRQETDPCERAEVDRALLSNIYQIWDASGAPTAPTVSTVSCAATGSSSGASGWND